MSFDINSTAQQIFSNLNVRDGKSDNKIGLKADNTYDNSIWNKFADAAGGQHINNYIEQGNAVNSIKTYLQRAAGDSAKLSQIASAGGVSITQNTAEPAPENTKLSPPSIELPEIAGINIDINALFQQGIQELNSQPIVLPNIEQSNVPTESESVVVSEQPEVVVAEGLKEAPSTGDTVAISNDDGTSYEINTKDQTITKYGSDGSVIEQRPMSSAEQNLSTQDLIDQLQTPTVSEEVESVEEKPVTDQPSDSPVPRKIKGDGMIGSYTIQETEGEGYKLEQNFTVSTFQNKAAIAFNKGLDFTTIKRDEEGFYNFRGIKSESYNILQRLVQIKSEQIAINTAIYQDLQSKQAGGEELSTAEQKFMSDYETMIKDSGLQMNESGALEDIPVLKKGLFKKLFN